MMMILFCFVNILSSQIEQVSTQEKFPVGIIRNEYGMVRLYFRHYSTFKEAVEKWEQRKLRINWNNIYVVMEGGFASEQNIRDFDELPFENKVIFLRDGYYSKNSITIPRRFYDMSFHHGKLLEYTGRNLRRNFEILDYVNFINGRGIKMTKLFKPVL